MVGKWHLGRSQNDTLPLERGFDSFYGILGAQFHPFLHISGRPMLYDNDNLVDQSGDYATYLFSDRAEKILRTSSDKPKFIYLSYTAPHAPHQSWADSDTDSDKVMTPDTDMGSDKGMSENLGHGFGLGQLSGTRVRPTLMSRIFSTDS